jgi:hypothetical protein
MTDQLDLPYVPMTVYYLHYKDERLSENNWNVCGDYVCCVMARTQPEAIEKVKAIASNQRGHKYIKIMGFGHAKAEWVDEESPLVTDESEYTAQVTALFNRIQSKSISANDIYNNNKSKNQVI